MAANQEPSPIASAGLLLRHAKTAILATEEAGQPYAALVTPALDEAANPILLLSSLAVHTGHLRANPACALFISGEAKTKNPQTTPRLCLTGTAYEAEPTDEIKEIYLKAHPYAAGYAGFKDFGFWRLQMTASRFIGGFAQAYDLDFAALQHEILQSPAKQAG